MDSRTRSPLVGATLAVAAAVLMLPGTAAAQLRGAAALDQSLVGITSTARVLLIAAHPDDEDTQALAWLTRGKHVETAYLSLTRGDGGQNLIGPELGDALGAIRTEELLAARRVDGGRQYFTRAYDFGFSKNADETATHWPRDSILADVVTVIRAFRPQVIYSIWSGTRADGHGHHEYAGQMARAGFDAAGDTVRFPVSRYGPAWTPLKFYRRGPGGLALPVNDYEPVLGETYARIAAVSRSQHRSQGFGGIALGSIVPGSGGRGFFGGLRLEASRVGAADPATDRGIFDGVDTSFARLVAEAPAPVQPLLRTVGARADTANATLDLATPWSVMPLVMRMAATIQDVRAQVPACRTRRDMTEPGGSRLACTAADLDLDASVDLLERRAAQAVLAVAEIEIDPTAPRELMAFGDSVPVTVAIVNHGRTPVTVGDVRITGGPREGFRAVMIAPGDGVAIRQDVIGYPDLRPWWLGGPHADGMFPARRSPADGIARVSAVRDDLVPGVAVSEEMRRMSSVRVTLRIDGQSVTIDAGQVIHREADPITGVQDQPLGGVPPVTIAFDGILEYVPALRPIDRYLRLTLRSFADSARTFSMQVVAPEGIKVDSLPNSVTLKPREQRDLLLRLRGSLKPGRHEFGVIGQYADGSKFAEGFFPVNYPHIRPINLYRSSALYLEAVDVVVPSRLTVAYIQGVGDNTAGFLRQLGIPVTVVQPADVPNVDLSRFSTVVVGTRAFDASGVLAAYAPRLMAYARNGGTLVVQYGQRMADVPAAFPYPLAWASPAERVTVEDAPVTVVDSASSLLRFPNALGRDDWADWVQERALYMPSTIDARYGAPLEMHDPGEKANRGAILTSRVGRGVYVFTTLSLFRQVPNGVTGSVRLWVNLLSAGAAPRGPTP